MKSYFTLLQNKPNPVRIVLAGLAFGLLWVGLQFAFMHVISFAGLPDPSGYILTLALPIVATKLLQRELSLAAIAVVSLLAITLAGFIMRARELELISAQPVGVGMLVVLYTVFLYAGLAVIAKFAQSQLKKAE
jgi:uncharacterized membrane protein YpjA